jgi:hypothetical protein
VLYTAYKAGIQAFEHVSIKALVHWSGADKAYKSVLPVKVIKKVIQDGYSGNCEESRA